MKPIDIATRHTADFVLSAVERQSSRILEIGCGDGRVGAVLVAAAHRVIGIDSDENAVNHARARGVDARLGRWPMDIDEGEFDAVVFSRSLHHIELLGAAVAAARRSLRVGGRLIVEDFAIECVAHADVEWLVQMLAITRAAGLQAAESDLLQGAQACGDAMAAWRDVHHDDLYPSAAMANEIQRVFGPLRRSATPYLFRYVIDVLNETAPASAAAAALPQLESRHAACAGTPEIGWRAVAERR